MPFLQLALASILCQGGAAPPSPVDKLVIEDITPGKGDPAAMGDLLTVDYTGALTNGKVFDSSTKPGRAPFDVMLGISSVIKGWTQGLVGMKPDGVRKLTIPGSLGYGPQGAPPDIPPNATLVFTITLHKISHPVNLLKISVTKPGDGPALTWGDAAMIKLSGKTSDGKVFVDTGTSAPRGVRFDVGVTRLPPGFTLGLIGMKKGERRAVVVPPELGFGSRGQPQLNIKPNETLTLDLELVTIEDPAAPARNKDTRSN